MKKQSEVVPQQESSGVVVRETLKEIADRANKELSLQNEKLIGMYKEQLRRCIQQELLSSARSGNYSLEIIPITLHTKINIYPDLEKYNSYKVINSINAQVCRSVASDNGISFRHTDYSSLMFEWK